jgi:Methyltransferase domain
MKTQAIMITCPERAETLDQTLMRLEHTDWEGSVYIQRDPCASDDPRVRQTQNVKDALGWFLSQSEADFALILEDDLDFNSHLHWNLERWSPMVGERLHFGSLYNPNIRSLSEGEDHFVADPAACYGSQAYLFSRYAVALVLQHWDRVIGMQDIKVTRILAGAGQFLYYHKPSLVQHVGTESVWGGGFHCAVDFDRDWQASFSYDRIPGWFTFPKLYQQAIDEAADGEVLVEVGAWLGRSTAFLGEKAKASAKRIKVIVVDTFAGSPNELDMVSAAAVLGGSVRNAFERNMRLAGVREYLEIQEAHSTVAAAAVPDGSCAFVFIDADHRYDAVRADIRAWIGKVRCGGILAGHDCHTYSTVYNAVRDEFGNEFETTDENVWIYRVAR